MEIYRLICWAPVSVWWGSYKIGLVDAMCQKKNLVQYTIDINK